MRYFKEASFGGLLLLFTFLSPSLAFSVTENYDQSCANAKNHANSPSGWLAPDGSIVMIPPSGGSFGLNYDSSGNVILRTATLSAFFSSNYVGQANYKIFGTDPTTTAAFLTTGNDFTKFYDGKGGGATNTDLIKIIEQGLGINNATPSHNAIVEYSASPDNSTIMRPARNPDITSADSTQYGEGMPFVQPSGMSDTAYSNFKAFYNYWITHTTPGTADQFPWTQLGYTYFWGQADNVPPLSKILGMSEFIILAKTPVNIYGIYATSSYIYTKNKNGAFSTDSDAEYGNGFANFKITGACDAVWAGHSFQNNVSRDVSNPNQIIITSAGNMLGGSSFSEGILVWSLNYTVNNSGTISGATVAKFKVADTNNIAILFEGDTSVLYGAPILAGKNILINSGRVSSTGTVLYPGIAVYVTNGDTDITNSGTIAAYDSRTDSYGIWLKQSTNTITNSGTIGTISGEGTSGTGIRLDGGNTTITNNIGGTIYGNTNAILITGGANTINNYGTISSANTAIKINAGTASLANSGTITGNVTLANDSTAALDVGNGSVSITGDYTQNALATLKVTANSSTDVGALTATNVSNASSKMNVTIGGYTPNGTVFSNVLNGTGASVPGTITSSSPIFTFSGAVASNKVSLTATRANTYTSFSPSSNAATAGSVLNTVAMNNTATGDMRTLLGALDSLTSGGQINDALSSLTPNTDNSVPQTGYETQYQFINTILSHFDNIPSVQTARDAGVTVLGNDVRKAGVWAQGFDTYLHEDPRGLSNGYDANVIGTAIGYDVPIIGDLILGFNGGYAWNNIRTKDSSARTTANSYEGSVYGSYSHDAYYIDSILSFAYNQYDSTRHVALGVIDRTPKADYGGQQYSAYMEGGYTFKNKVVTLTPLGSLQYMRLHVNSYTEDGAGAANLSVSAQDYDMFQTGLGARLACKIPHKDYTVIPDVHFKWLYDFIGDNQQATSTFTGGGASFATNGFDPAQSSYDIGTRLVLLTKSNITIALNYDFEIKEDFYSHAGYADCRYDF